MTHIEDSSELTCSDDEMYTGMEGLRGDIARIERRLVHRLNFLVIAAWVFAIGVGVLFFQQL